ncbi:hypothetical protein B0O80DRAFT_448601 [Mortierella sp. GBAus27b]|nr:hypothetical protein B0O80DRAFT_448601 [Mortierella sp. GBAus27b]
MSMAASPSSPDSRRLNQPPLRPHPPLIQQHQPFPSSSSSFSVRHSSYSSSSSGFLSPNDTPRLSYFNGPASRPKTTNHSLSLNLDRRPLPSRSTSLFDHGSRSNIRPKMTAHEASVLLQDSASDVNSLHTIDNSTPIIDSDDSGDDIGSYFGSAGQDYLLKKKRAKRSILLCWLDCILLAMFIHLTAWRAPEPGNEGLPPGGAWTWDWNRISWTLLAMTVVRVLVMAFTARYSGGNYNVAVIFVCVMITLLSLFEINMIVQNRLELSAALIAHYSASLVMTQLHWISYSAYTPMSATPTYDYDDPLLNEGITFSRESRYYGTSSQSRTSILRQRPSYGTMGTSPFDTVEELNEEPDDDPDAFIKVDIARQLLVRRSQTQSSTRQSQGNAGGGDTDGQSDGSDADGEEEEEHDMATLLAFQDARRQQVFAFSPTASSAVLPERSLLSPHIKPNESSHLGRWGYQGRQDSYASSYDMRLAAAGTSGAAAVSGGLTVGYTPRRRSLRPNMDPHGTGRRTWTTGRNIIYSGIFVEDSDDEVDPGQGAGDDSLVPQDNDEDEPRFMDFDDTLKINIDDIDSGTADMDVDDTGKVDVEDLDKSDLGGSGKADFNDTDKADLEDTVNVDIDGTVNVDDEAIIKMDNAAGTIDANIEDATRVDYDDTVKVDIDDIDKANTVGVVKEDTDDTTKVNIDDTVKVDVDDIPKVATDGAVKTDIDHTVEMDVDSTIQVEIDNPIKTSSDSTTETIVETTVETEQSIQTQVDITIKADSCDDLKPESGAIELSMDERPEGNVTDGDSVMPDHPTPMEVTTQLDTSETSTHGDVSIELTDNSGATRVRPHFLEPLADHERPDTTVTLEGDAESSEESPLQVRRHHPHGLSTLKIHLSSHKDITAVVCDDDNCSEHQFQEGPAAELENVLGTEVTGNIVQLDIQESSTYAAERNGEGINDFDDSSAPNTIRLLPDGMDPSSMIDIHSPDTVLDDKKHGPKKIHVGEKIGKPKPGLESESPLDIADPTLETSLPGAIPQNSRRTDTCTADNGDHKEGGHRRVRVHERVERTTIETEEDRIDGVIIGGVVGGVVVSPGSTPTGVVVGGVVVTDGPLSNPVYIPRQRPTIVPPPPNTTTLVPLPQPAVAVGPSIQIAPPPQAIQLPPQFVIQPQPQPDPQVTFQPPQITFQPPPITIQQPDPQPPTPSPPVYRLPPKPVIQLPPRPVIQLPPPPVIQLPPPEPIILPPPEPIIIPAPEPVIFAPPPPQPLVYSPPPRPIIAPPSHPVFVAQPEPQAIVQPGVAIVPQPAGIVPAPYGPYGVGGVAGFPGGFAPMHRGGYSVASIYEDDIHSVASIYDDRSIISIHELENGPVMGPAIGPVMRPAMGPAMGPVMGPVVGPRQAWVQGQPLPGMAHGYHMASASHLPRQESEVRAMHVARPEDMQVDHATGAFMRGDQGYWHYDNDRGGWKDHTVVDMRHDIRQPSEGYTEGGETDMYGMGAARHGARQISEGYTEGGETDMYGMDPVRYDSRQPSEGYTEAGETEMYGMNAARHEEALVPDTEGPETSYQELEIQQGLAQDMAVETYYDTTKTQFKVREQKGQFLSDMVRQLKKRQEQIQEQELTQQLQYAQQEPLQTRPLVLREQQVPDLKAQRQSPSSPPFLARANHEARTSPTASSPSLLSRSLQQQQQQQQVQSPPRLNIPKPPQSPPPVRLLVNKGVALAFGSPRGIPLVPRSPPRQQQSAAHSAKEARSIATEDEPILSKSSFTGENIMMQPRQLRVTPLEIGSGASKASAEPTTQSNQFLSGKAGMAGQGPAAAAAARKIRKKQHIPAMSRHQLHPVSLHEGIMACWNNEFATALEIFKEHEEAFPRWSLATAEVHIVRQLISGQLSEADSELMDALQQAEKVASRVLDRRQEFDSSFMSYRSVCSADATLITVNDNTLRQNYKWDCEMAFYDALLYRGILQLTSAPDTKGTFSDIKGGLQLRRAWKGYMRIKQEMENAKERWQKLSTLVQQSSSASATTASQDQKGQTTSSDGSKANRASKPTKTTTMPIAIPSPTSNAHPPSAKSSSPLSTSQPTEGSRWSIFGRRSSSTASLSSSPADGAEYLQDGSRFLSSSPSAPKGLASMLREQTKAAEDIKTAVRVLEDVEDYQRYGMGLFYFIASIVPKSLLPALRTIGLQANHEQGIADLEFVFTRKNGRAPFAALFLLINYLFLPRGMADPSISLGRAGEIIEECLKSCPNGSSYLLMACHHARKTGNMIPSALNHITRGIQTCEAACIPSINYRFELGLTFFIHQEFGKAADIFEILWRRFGTTAPPGGAASTAGLGSGRKRKGRSNSISQPARNDSPTPSFGLEEDEEDDFELAPFCGLCLIASKVVVRLGQEGYFEYGRDGFGHRNQDSSMSPVSGLLSESGSGSTTPLNYPRPGPESDLLIAAHDVLLMMSGTDPAATMKSEHSKSASSQSTDTNGGRSTVNSQFWTAPAPTQTGKLNRFNKFAWSQCQKSLQRGRISPFLPLVILYLRRDVAYMKPGLLRKYRTLLEVIWKNVQQTADADTQAIYLLLSAVVHRHLLPDDSTFAYTSLTDCLLLESTIENEMWVVPHCHYELGELLYKKLHLPQAALEQFQWIVKGPGKEARPVSIFYGGGAASSNSNRRLSVFGGGFPSDTVTNIVESVAASQAAQAAATGGGHSNQPSTTSSHRLSQLFSGGATGGNILGTSPTHPQPSNPPNPVTFYNSRYKKFEFSQALRQRSAICVEQIQKEIDNTPSSKPASRRTSMSASGDASGNDVAMASPNNQDSRKRLSSQSIDLTDQGAEGSKSARVSTYSLGAEASNSNPLSATRSPSEHPAPLFQQGWTTNNSMPNILSDAQRKRGSQQWNLGRK